MLEAGEGEPASDTPGPGGAAPSDAGAPRRFAFHSLVWLAIATGWAAALSAYGALPAVLSHGVPLASFLVALALGLTVFAIATARAKATSRSWIYVGLLAGAELLLVALVLPDIRGFLGARTSPVGMAAGRSVSLVELNVWDLNRDPQRTITWLRDQNADIIILAEARESFVRDLARAFPDYPTLVTCDARPYCGAVILSRFSGELLPGGRWVANGYRHSTPGDQGMALAAVELDIPDQDGVLGRTPVVAVHLDRRGVSAVIEHQVKSLLQAVEAASGRLPGRLILAGDFNASPWSPPMRRFDRMVGAKRMSAFAPTWPSQLRAGVDLPLQPLLAIDHIYLGCAWKLRRLRVGRDVGSDHRPLVARFDPRSGATADCTDVRKGRDAG